MSDLEAEQARDEKTLAEVQARIWARKRLMTAAKEYSQLSGHKPPKAASSKPLRANGAAKHVEAVPPTPPAPVVRTKLAKGSGSYSIVLDVLRENAQGLPARDVGRKASEHPQAAESLKHHGNYVYSILDNLAKRGQVVKGGDGKWKIAKTPAPGVH